MSADVAPFMTRTGSGRPASDAARGVAAARPGLAAIIIGSGKGGVGKSVLTVMLGAALARDGRRVLLLDGAQNLGNLHVLTGVRPAGHLDGFLSGMFRAAELVTPVTANLWLVPSDSGAESVHALNPVDRARLHCRLCTLYDGFDVVIVDAGPGIEAVVRVSTMRATQLIVVTLAESTALSDACALIKIVNLQVPNLPIGVIANRTLSDAEGLAAFERLRAATRPLLPREPEYLGAVPEDPAMRLASRCPELLLEPGSVRAVGAVRRLVAGRLPRFLGAAARDRVEEIHVPE